MLSAAALALIAVALLGGAPACSGGAGAPDASSDSASAGGSDFVVFDEDFEAGNTSQWALSEEWLVVAEGGDHYLRGRGDGWLQPADPIVRSTYRLRFGLRLWRGELAINYREHLESGYGLLLVGEDLVLERHVYGEGRELANARLALSDGQWHTLDIDGDGGHLQVLVDGDSVLDVTDEDPWLSGSFGFHLMGDENARADFDDIQVLVPAGEVSAGQWVQTGGPTAERIETVEIDPRHPDTLYAAGVGGRVYRSSDAAASWSELTRFTHRWMSIADVLIAPDGSSLYARTQDAELGGCLYGSDDEGVSWRMLSVPPGVDRWDQCSLTGAAVVPSGSLGAFSLVAGDREGRVFRSDDRGVTWRRVGQLDPPQPISTIQAGRDGTLWAGTADEGRGRLHRSRDGGVTWQRMPLEQPIQTDVISVFVDPDDPALIFVGLNIFPEGEGPPGTQHLHRSTDGGRTWKPLDLPVPAWGVHVLGRVRGSGELFVHNGFTVHRSRDDGDSWDTIETLPVVHGPIADMAVDERDPPVLYLPGGVVGLLKSTDGGESWAYSDRGIINTAVQIVAVAPSSSPSAAASSMVAPTRNGRPSLAALYSTGPWEIFKSTDEGDSWTHLLSENMHPVPDELVVSPHDPDTVWYVSDVGQMYASEDGGGSWTKLNDPFTLPDPDPFSGWQPDWETNFRFGSVYALAPSPSLPGTVYALKNGFGIMKTTDGGRGWQFLADSLVDYTYAIAVHPTDPDIVFSGYNPKPFQDWSMVRRSTDGGVSWTTALSLPHASGVTSVAIDQQQPSTVYAGSTGMGVDAASDSGAGATRPGAPPGISGEEDAARTGSPAEETARGGAAPGISGEESVRGGAIWVSRDGGDSWENLHEPLNFTNVHVLAADPNEPLTAYAGVWGGGTFKTTDGGDTWARLPADPTISASAILVDLTDSDVIYLADRTAPRVYRSTDGGETWETYFDAGPGYYRVLGATLAPGGVLYASVFGRGGPMDGDLFRIVGGVGTVVTGALPRLPVALAADPRDADVLYVALHGFGVYSTSDGGSSWRELSTAGSGLPTEPHVGFNGIVVATGPSGDRATGPAGEDADPGGSGVVGEANALYLLGGCDVQLDLSHSGADPKVMNTVYRSLDGGATWTNLDDGHLGEFSGAIKGLAVAPEDANVLYLGALRGVYRSTDGGATWELAGSGLAYRTTAGVSVSGDGRRLYAPTLGGGVYAADVDAESHDLSWDESSHLVATIDHVQVTVDPSDSATIYASAYPGGLFKSTDGGRTWSECNFGMASFEITDPSRQGYYAFAVAPSDPAVLYLGLYGVGVYRSEDGAATWRPVDGAAREMGGRHVTSLIVDPVDADRVYVATEDGVFFSQDGGAHWTEMSRGLDVPDVRVLAWGADGRLYGGTRGYEVYAYDPGEEGVREWQQLAAFSNLGQPWPIWDRASYQFTTVAFHPSDPDVVFAGTFPAGMFKSTDGGRSWHESSVGWGNDGVFSLVFRPGDSDTIYAGTYNGINRSVDGGATWEARDEGWPGEQWVTSITFDSRDPDVMYACSLNGEDKGRGRMWFGGTVMKSTDAGATWFPITRGLNLNQPFLDIIADPVESGTVYLATGNEGVFVTRDGGGLWLPWNDGLAVLDIGGTLIANPMALSPDGRELFLGSGGAGVYRRRLEQGSVGPSLYLPLAVR